MWVSTQRKRKDKTDLEKQLQLESLPQWSWDILEDQWSKGFEFLKKYVDEHGQARVPRGFKYEDFNLDIWVSTQRHKRDKLDLEKIKKLDSLPQWSWNIIEDQWNEGFSFLKNYVEEYDHTRVPAQYKYGDFNLGMWVSTQRRTKDKLDLEKIKALELLPKWSWDAIEDKWNDGFEYLTKYVEEFGHAKVPAQYKYRGFNLGAWVRTQRKINNRLDLEKIKKLESLTGWSW